PALDGHAARGELDEQEPGRVVRLRAEDETEREQHRVGVAERPERAYVVVSHEPAQPGDPDRRERQAERDQLERWELRAVADRVLVRDLAREVELRPAVLRLPDEVRQPDRNGERCTGPQPPAAQRLEPPREDEPERERRE